MVGFAGCLALMQGAFAQGASASDAGGSGAGKVRTSAAPSPFGALVVPGVQELDGGQQIQAQLQARRLSPAAVAARVRSRTAFRGLSAARAAQVARELFSD